MSLRATAWAWKVPVPAHIQPTLLALADYHNDKTGQCNPRLSTLAAKVRRGQSTVRKHLAWLEAQGLITRSDHHVPGRADRASTFALAVAVSNPPLVSERGPRSPVSALEPEEEPEEKYRTSSCVDQEVDDEQKAAVRMAVGDGDWSSMWGSSADRTSVQEQEDRARLKREAREARAMERAEIIAARPRSAWGPGDLGDFFRAQTFALDLAVMPRLPFPPEIRGAFAEMLTKGHRPEDIASAIEVFFETESLWWEPLQNGAELWRVFMARAPGMSEKVAVVVDDGPLDGRSW